MVDNTVGGFRLPGRLITVLACMAVLLLLVVSVSCRKQTGAEESNDPAASAQDAESAVSDLEPEEPVDGLAVRQYSQDDLARFRAWLKTDAGEMQRKLEDDGAILTTDYLVQYISMGNMNLIVQMIAAGVDLNGVSSKGIHPLSEAVLQNDKYLVDLLIEKGADVHLRDEGQNGFGRGLLHYAAKVNNLELAKQLIELGEEIDLADLNDQTPLDIAVESGQNEMLQLLIELGADPLRESRGGSVPILLAAGNGQSKAIRLLVEHGADVNFRHERGWTPLLLALYYNHEDTAEYLLEHGADVSARLKEGYGAAGIAATLSNAGMLRRIIDAGAPVDYEMESSGRNIIHACAENALSQFIEELVAAGIDPAKADKSGITPLDIARQVTDAETIRILDDLTGDEREPEGERKETDSDTAEEIEGTAGI